MLATIGAGFYFLVQAGARWQRGEALVAWSPRRAVPWGFLDLNVALFMLLAAGVIVVQTYRQWGGAAVVTLDAEPTLDKLPQSVLIGITIADSLLKLAVMLAAIAFISFRTGANKHDWGWNPKHLGEDIVTGLKAFAVLVPVVLALQATLVYVFEWKSEHPLLENLKASPSLTLYVASLVAAAFVAPLAEEWAFRVLLQGWMEKVALRRYSWEQLLIGGPTGEEVPRESDAGLDEVEEKLPPAKAPATNLGNPYRSPDEVSGPIPLSPSAKPTGENPPWWPVVISAALFAVVHISHGPDFLPLFFLALGLGYLYRQTHRIVPSMVVHFCLNFLTMLGMGAQLLSGQ
jgi:membrane protease YdiL (CAAX protease family)